MIDVSQGTHHKLVSWNSLCASVAFCSKHPARFKKRRYTSMNGLFQLGSVVQQCTSHIRNCLLMQTRNFLLQTNISLVLGFLLQFFQLIPSLLTVLVLLMDQTGTISILRILKIRLFELCYLASIGCLVKQSRRKFSPEGFLCNVTFSSPENLDQSSYIRRNTTADQW